MTKTEVLKILTICKEVGVQFTNSNNNILEEIWYKSFKDNSYQEVSKALFELINTRKSLFLNGLIGEIKAQIYEGKHDFPDFATVWQTLRKAMHDTHPDIPQETIKAYNSLPPMLKHLVGSPQHLQEMEYALDRDTLETVEKSNIRKIYTELVSTTKNRLMLGKPPVWEKLPPKENKRLDAQVNRILSHHSMEGI